MSTPSPLAPGAASQRQLVRGLISPFPIGHMLPAMYQGDDFSQRFTAALDEVLASIHSTLDCLPAYLRRERERESE